MIVQWRENLSGNCNTKSLVYRGEVKYTETNPRTNLDEEKSKFYTGLTELTFSQRHKLHKTSFTNQNYSGSTSLSSFVWELKALGINHEVEFSIVKLARPYNRESKICDLREDRNYVFWPPRPLQLTEQKIRNYGKM